MTPHKVTQDFERRLCEYTAAPYAVAVNSCTMAILLAAAWGRRFITPGQEPQPQLGIPRRTYVSVPQSLRHAGWRPTFRDEEWLGYYEIEHRMRDTWRLFDSARWFTCDLYPILTGWDNRTPCDMVCVSFHASKTLGLEQGGAILHNSPEADRWLRAARFDGRTEGVAPKDDAFTHGIGWHCYMNPSTAAQGILKLHSLPLYHAPLPNDDYPDLSELEMFR